MFLTCPKPSEVVATEQQGLATHLVQGSGEAVFQILAWRVAGPVVAAIGTPRFLQLLAVEGETLHRGAVQ